MPSDSPSMNGMIGRGSVVVGDAAAVAETNKMCHYRKLKA